MSQSLSLFRHKPKDKSLPGFEVCRFSLIPPGMEEIARRRAGFFPVVRDRRATWAVAHCTPWPRVVPPWSNSSALPAPFCTSSLRLRSAAVPAVPLGAQAAATLSNAGRDVRVREG